MSDEVKKVEVKSSQVKAEISDPVAYDGATTPNWDVGNTNVSNGPVDVPHQVLDHPQFFGRSTGQIKTNLTPETAPTIPAGSFPSLRVHGFSSSGNHATGQLNYYTVYTSVDITPTGMGVVVTPAGSPPGVYNDVQSNSQLMLDKLVETISLRAQPIIMSQITSMAFGAYVSPETVVTFQPTSGFVWALSFAIDHNGAWDTAQGGWINSLNPVGVARGPISGGPTVYASSNNPPDLGSTIGSNLAFGAGGTASFVNDGLTANKANNNFVVVSSGPF